MYREMRCPYCGYKESKVVDSRPAEEGSSIRRRRECLSCEKRFTTYEKVEEVMDTAMQYAEDTNEMMPYVAVSRYKSGKRQEAYDMLRMYMGIGEHFSAKLIENMCPEMMEDNVIQEIIDSCGDKIK